MKLLRETLCVLILETCLACVTMDSERARMDVEEGKLDICLKLARNSFDARHCQAESANRCIALDMEPDCGRVLP